MKDLDYVLSGQKKIIDTVKKMGEATRSPTVCGHYELHDFGLYVGDDGREVGFWRKGRERTKRTLITTGFGSAEEVIFTVENKEESIIIGRLTKMKIDRMKGCLAEYPRMYMRWRLEAGIGYLLSISVYPGSGGPVEYVRKEGKEGHWAENKTPEELRDQSLPQRLEDARYFMGEKVADLLSINFDVEINKAIADSELEELLLDLRETAANVIALAQKVEAGLQKMLATRAGKCVQRMIVAIYSKK